MMIKEFIEREQDSPYLSLPIESAIAGEIAGRHIDLVAIMNKVHRMKPRVFNDAMNRLEITQMQN